MTTRIRRIQRRQRRQSGNVLLIVLLILMMATSTATFVMHSSGQDQRAAGAMRNAVRARYIAETAALTTLVLAEETPVGVPMNWGTWQLWTEAGTRSDNRWRYGLPFYASKDPLVGMDPHNYLLQSTKFAPMCADQSALQDPMAAVGGTALPSSGMYALSPRFDGVSPRAASAPMRLLPRFSSLAEVWPINRAGRPAYRYIITGFGELIDPSVTPVAGERSPQDIVTMSRAYYDVR